MEDDSSGVDLVSRAPLVEWRGLSLRQPSPAHRKVLLHHALLLCLASPSAHVVPPDGVNPSRVSQRCEPPARDSATLPLGMGAHRLRNQSRLTILGAACSALAQESPMILRTVPSSTSRVPPPRASTHHPRL